MSDVLRKQAATIAASAIIYVAAVYSIRYILSGKVFDDCVICAETVPLTDFVQVSCCGQKLCRMCVDRIIETKATQASEMLSFYLSRRHKSHQCPQCACGPIEHFACSDLTLSSHNRCPKCKFKSNRISAWPTWNGELCESLRAYEHGGKINCPFCRKKCSLKISFMSKRFVGVNFC